MPALPRVYSVIGAEARWLAKNGCCLLGLESGVNVTVVTRCRERRGDTRCESGRGGAAASAVGLASIHGLLLLLLLGRRRLLFLLRLLLLLLARRRGAVA